MLIAFSQRNHTFSHAKLQNFFRSRKFFVQFFLEETKIFQHTRLRCHTVPTALQCRLKDSGRGVFHVYNDF